MPTCCLLSICTRMYATSLLNQLKYLGQGHTGNLPPARKHENDVADANHTGVKILDVLIFLLGSPLSNALFLSSFSF